MPNMLLSPKIKPCFFVLCLSLLAYHTSLAQNQRYGVQVGAFEESVKSDYFKSLKEVYETIDVNNIYRYYIDAPDRPSAESIKEEAIKKGFAYSQVVDFEEIKAKCEAQCGYTPPSRTAKRMDNSSPSRQTAEANVRTENQTTKLPPATQSQRQVWTTVGTDSSTWAIFKAQNPKFKTEQALINEWTRQTRLAQSNNSKPKTNTPQTPNRQTTNTPANTPQTPNTQTAKTTKSSQGLNSSQGTENSQGQNPKKTSPKKNGGLPADIHTNPKYADFKGL